MSVQDIRLFGDPVLKQRAREIEDLDEDLVRLSHAMIDTMYEAPGTGLAAPQVGVQRRMFVWDVGDGPHTVVNPEIVETSGHWSFEEGCLSVPGLYFELERPKVVTLRGVDLDGGEVLVQGDELLGRVFLHEIDHLDGVLVLDRLDRDRRKEAMRALREQRLSEQAGVRAVGQGAAGQGSARGAL